MPIYSLTCQSFEFNTLFFREIKVMLRGTIRDEDIFSATHRCNVGTMLDLFETMFQQCCNAVLS